MKVSTFKKFIPGPQNALEDSCRFHVQIKNPKNRAVRIVFNSGIVRRLGLGEAFKSASLYWSKDTQEILIKLHEKKFRGERSISKGQYKKGLAYVASISVTMFLRSMRIPFQERKGYIVNQISKNEIIINMADENEPEPI